MANRTWLPISSSDPVASRERVLDAPELAVLTASLALGAPAVMTGVDLLGREAGIGLTISQLILAAPLGIVLAAGCLIAVAYAAAEGGVPAGLLLRPALGVAGSWAAMALVAAFLVAWTALELEFGASAFVAALAILGVAGVPAALVTVALAVAAGLLLAAGLAWVTRVWLYRFAFWAAIVLTGVLAWQFTANADLSSLAEVTPSAAGFWVGVDGMLVLGVIWFPVVADTARFATAAPAAASGVGTGFSVAALLLVTAGGVRAASIDLAGGSPADLLVEGTTSVGAVIVIGWLLVASTDQPFLLSFSGATALSSISDRFAGRVQAIALLCVGLVVALAVPGSVLREVTNVIVVVLAQMLAVLLNDYFLVRRRRYEADELYRRTGTYAGVNLYGLIAVVLGSIVALLIRPVGPEGWVEAVGSLTAGLSAAMEGLPPILVSMLVTSAVYAVLGRWKIRERVVVSRLRGLE